MIRVPSACRYDPLSSSGLVSGCSGEIRSRLPGDSGFDGPEGVVVTAADAAVSGR